MKPIRCLTALALIALTACSQDKGVGLGPLGSGQSALPQSTRTTFALDGLKPLPNYSYDVAAGDASPAYAATVGGSPLRAKDANLLLEVEGTTYAMRHITLNGSHFVVAEGGQPVASLPSAIKTRTGCLVASEPLRAKSSVVYTLNCS